MSGTEKWGISRRDFLRAAGTLGISGALLGAYAGGARGHDGEHHVDDIAQTATEHSHSGNSTVGNVDTSRFDPTRILRDFYWGEERREGGRVVREYELTAEEVEIEVAPGVMYPAWTYNGQVPGPTLRATEGDRLRVVFRNRSVHPHTIHFHGFHPANMDGVFEQVGPGQEFVYEFDAEVPVAVLTPGFSGEIFFRYALIGTYVGVIPVALGLLWYPFLRRLGSSGMNFVLALTVGLLAFLVIDTLEEAMEVAAELPGVFSGIPLVILLTLLTLLGLLAAARLFRRGREETSRLGTSYRIALGIGLHNLAIGAGAILQVIYEVTRLLLKDSARSKTPTLSAPNLGGFVGGVAIMYATALLVSV